MPEHPTRYIAERIVETGLAAAPPEAIAIAKDTFLDVVGCMLAGAVEPGSRMVADFARRMGSGPCSVVGTSLRVSPLTAALANGTSAAILDYDDSSWRAMCHLSGSVVPALLALGEERHATGRAVFEAYMVGFEAATKIGRGISRSLYFRGRHTTGTVGIFGATAACAKLLGLDATKTAIALGIAASCSGALRGNFGTMTKGLHSGSAAANGLMSASLAAEGFTARPDILECRYGFAEAAANAGEYDLDEVGRDFAAPWDVVDPGVGIKLSPAGTTSFCAGECAVELATRHDLDPRDIESVEFRTNTVAISNAPYALPNDCNEAFYCIQWSAAVGLVDRKTGLAQFSAERIGDPFLRELCGRVKLSIHPEHRVVDDPRDYAAGELVVRLKDGRELRHYRRRPRAYPGGEPWTRAQLLGKYRENAARSLPAQRVQQSISLLGKVEALPDIALLTKMLRPPRAR